VSNAVVVATSSAFPQLAANRTLGEIIQDLLDYSGGGDRGPAQDRARRAVAETIRLFNGMAWRFNRKTMDITFLASTSDYALNGLTRDVWKVMLLDNADEQVSDVGFVTYQDFLREDGSTQSPVTIPDNYTLFNTFDTGNIRFLPRLGATFSYPKARVFYHTRIAMPADDNSKIAVPPEVETAIVRQAAAILVARVRTFAEAEAAKRDADNASAPAIREWRDFPDFMQKMG
jgi:hypothetical protein